VEGGGRVEGGVGGDNHAISMSRPKVHPVVFPQRAISRRCSQVAHSNSKPGGNTWAQVAMSYLPVG